jgi:UDP-N-acetylglucosamine 2-epimerase
MSKNKIKIVTIVGARPQFIKAAVVSDAFKSTPEINEIILHTGQHYDYQMSQVFFKELKIKDPKYNLEIGSGSHGQQTGRMIEKIEEKLIKESPDLALVYGDTNSTLAGALAASKLNIKIAHVESGLRSHNRNMPEEINRALVDKLSSLLFCPTTSSVRNLCFEGLIEGNLFVGDVMYDSVLRHSNKKSTILNKLKLDKKKYVMATIHRAENTNYKTIKNIFDALNIIAKQTNVIVPIHPRTLKYIRHLSFERNIEIIDPLSYIDMLALEKGASVILTDSGGIQKEAYMLNTPCVTLRNETEWNETLYDGWNILAGTNTGDIVKAYDKLLKSSFPVGQSQCFGNGFAGKKIVDHIVNFFS